MSINFKTVAAIAVLAGTMAPAVSHADYYNPPRDYAYSKSFDGPGSIHTQVPFGFDKSRGQDKVTVVRPGGNGTILISEENRKSIKGFQERSYRSTCPTGTVKVGRSCNTDRNQNMTYVVGQPLSATVVVTPVANDLVAVMTPAPAGYRYVQVGADVLLVDNNGLIVDAVAF